MLYKIYKLEPKERGYCICICICIVCETQRFKQSCLEIMEVISTERIEEKDDANQENFVYVDTTPHLNIDFFMNY